MKKFYNRFSSSDLKLRQAVAVLPWGHILRLMQKVGNDDSEMLYYAQEAVAKGWNRDLLLNAIKLNMCESKLATKVDNNFSRTLPYGTWQWLHVHRQPTHVGVQRQRKQGGYAFLPPWLALPCSRRLEDWCFQARVCREDECFR